MVENSGKKNSKQPRLVGNFIRQRRESLGLSQRALGQRFEPSVTTQFISNVERGVTPLPPAHIPALIRALNVSEEEIMTLLEKEYAAKLSGRLGKEGEMTVDQSVLLVDPNDYDAMKRIYRAYKNSDASGKNQLIDAALRVTQQSSSQSSD